MKLILVFSPLQVFSWLGDQLHSSLRVSGNLAMELSKLWQQQNIICTRDKISSLGICEILKITLENLFPTISSASTGIGLSAPSRSTWSDDFLPKKSKQFRINYQKLEAFGGSKEKSNCKGWIIKNLEPLDDLKHRTVGKVEVAKVVDWSLPGVGGMVGKLEKKGIYQGHARIVYWQRPIEKIWWLPNTFSGTA